MSYSFKFEIVRWYNQNTEEWLTEKEFDDKFDGIPEDQHEKIYESFTEEIVKLNVKGSGYYRPAKIHGDPYDCYPEEFDSEIESAEDDNGYDWLNELTDSERKEAESELASKVYHGKPDYDNYDPGDKYNGFDYYGY